MINRNHKNWNAIYSTRNIQANIMIGIGIMLILFSLIGITVNDEEIDPISNLAIGMLFFLPGFIMVMLGCNTKRKLKIKNRIIQYINAKERIAMDELCKASGTNKNKTIESIMDLINKGMIDGHLDESNNLILNRYKVIKEQQERVQTIIKCRECGAKNKVTIGSSKECEYCGTILKAEVKC